MWRLFAVLVACPAFADSVVATQTISAQSTITAEDITLVQMDIPGAISLLEDAVGQTANTRIAAGRAVNASQITLRIQIERNAIVPLTLRAGGLEIRTEGRTLAAGGAGDTIDIMNLSSRTRIKGQIQTDGTILVSAAN